MKSLVIRPDAGIIERDAWSVHVRALQRSECAIVLPRFARLHYRLSKPATHDLVLGAFERDGPRSGRCVGVLCVSRPTLNGAWRALAWPTLFAPGQDPRTLARTLNVYVRTISRVIVHPSFRGMGVASSLVRAYLDQPLTPLTETLAAMGRMSPLFQRCGMREVPCPRSSRDRRLLAALRARGVRPVELVSEERARRALVRDPSLTREVAAWTRASKSTRTHALDDGDRETATRLLVLACAGVVARPLVFVTP